MPKGQFDSYEDHIILPRKTKTAFGVAGFGENLFAEVVNNSILLFYNTILMVPVTWVTWALAGTRFWDAVSDPLLGHFSDNTRSRWGRRRPYILFGGLFFALSFCAVCIPPAGLGAKGLFIYLATTVFLYYTAYTVTMVPVGALGAELTLEYHERTRLQAYRTFFSRVGSLLSATAWFLASRFPSFRRGFVVIGIAFALMGFLAFLATFSGTRENIEFQGQEKEPFLRGLRETARNRLFWLLAGMMFFLLLGINIGFPAGGYITMYYVFSGDKVAAAKVMMFAALTLQIVAMISTFPATWLGVRIGKEKTMLLGMASFAVAPPLSWLLYNPQYPYLQLLFMVPAAFSLTCVLVCVFAMMADLVDLDEVKTHKRREGSYAALVTFFFKLAPPIGTALFGLLLEYWARFDETLTVQPPETLLRMRLILMLTPLIPCAMAALLAFLYPLREPQVREVRALLEERRARRLGQTETRPPETEGHCRRERH